MEVHHQAKSRSIPNVHRVLALVLERENGRRSAQDHVVEIGIENTMKRKDGVGLIDVVEHEVVNGAEVVI